MTLEPCFTSYIVLLFFRYLPHFHDILLVSISLSEQFSCFVHCFIAGLPQSSVPPFLSLTLFLQKDAWPWRLGGEERKQRQPVFLHPLLLLLHTPVGLESHLSSTWFLFFWASLVAQRVKNPPEKQETQVLFLDQEDSQKKEMGTHSSILVWKIQWTEEPGGL